MKRANTFEAVFLRSYSRRLANGKRETWEETITRAFSGMQQLAQYTAEEEALVKATLLEGHTMMSGRWMWVGGTPWSKEIENYIGSYNCSNFLIDDISIFAHMMAMAMMGTGTGAVIEQHHVAKLPDVKVPLDVKVRGEYGFSFGHQEDTIHTLKDDELVVIVGDSRQGWCDAVDLLIRHAFGETPWTDIRIVFDVSSVRPKGKKLKGFGGVSNPNSLKALFPRLAEILNTAYNRDRRLTPVEACLILDECAMVVVAGNIRRSAGIKQGSASDEAFAAAKDNLWQEVDGKWQIDEKRSALRMSNHTRVYHQMPSLDDMKAAVTKQFYSGEGAIMYAAESIARANAHLIKTDKQKSDFFAYYQEGRGKEFLKTLKPDISDRELDHSMNRYGLNPCFAAGTMVMTKAGHFAIETLVGKTVEVWDGNNWVSIDNFRVTAENQTVYDLEMVTGEVITATPYHTFILETGQSKQLSELMSGDRLMLSTVCINDAYSGMVSAEVKSVTKNATIADKVYCCTVSTNNRFTLSNGLIVGNCAEIIGTDFLCNLSEVHLNTIDFNDMDRQLEAFRVAALVVVPLLTHRFLNERQQYSREIDPIVGVSFTGLFDFFAKGLGITWLLWWEAGRPEKFGNVDEAAKLLNTIPALWQAEFVETGYNDIAPLFKFIERKYLEAWRVQTETTVAEYCERVGTRTPNRCTTVQPAGSKSLLTGASPGWHPPKGLHYIRRITFAKNDPVALTLLDRGFPVVPGQADRDENGGLLNDPFSPLCTEWLVELPTKAIAAEIEGCDNIDPNQFSALSQFDFYMQVQTHYTRHNTSATIELREDEIDQLAEAIYQSLNNGYISAALLPRLDAPFPRLPFENVTHEVYDQLMVLVENNAKIDESEFMERLQMYDSGEIQIEGPAGCDSALCLNPKTVKE